MMLPLERLRGISEEECRSLRSLAVFHTNQLIHVTTLVADRKRLSERTGIPEERLLVLGRQAALIEVSGLERHRRVVMRLGVTSLRELRAQDPATFQLRILEAVGQAQAPSVSEVQYWVSQARQIDVLEEPDEEQLRLAALKNFKST